jgi:flagellar protein FlaI
MDNVKLIKKIKKTYSNNSKSYDDVLKHAFNSYLNNPQLHKEGTLFARNYKMGGEIFNFNIVDLETYYKGIQKKINIQNETQDDKLPLNNQKINNNNNNNINNTNSINSDTPNLENVPENSTIDGKNSMSNFEESINRGFEKVASNLAQIGNMPGINIVAKNYITPDTFDSDASGEDVEKVESKSSSLAKIPDKLLKESKTDWEPINFKNIDDTYDLYNLAKTKIEFNEEEQKLMYLIIEPELNEEEMEILEELKRAFIFVFEKFSPSTIENSGRNLLEEGTRKLCNKYSIKLNEEQFKKIVYFLDRDFLGLEKIEPLMHDPYIEDISCDGLNVPIFINHLKYGPIETNKMYTDNNKLNSFIIKLAQKSNQEVSLSKPILQGALTDGSRVEAIYGKEISEKGSSYTIRKFRAEPFTPIHLIDFGTMPPFLLAYLWLAVEYKQSILVSGGTATGKTTTLNALSLFVPPNSKIVSIEDTPEINLPHEHWLAMVARESNEKSQVTMFDLLKASLRERPEYIIVGEIRGSEAAVLFQGMATGHAGLGTFHAEKFEDLINRMTIDPINLPIQLITELAIVLFIKQIKIKDNLVRRVNSVIEVVEFDHKTKRIHTNEFISYRPEEDTFSFSEKSRLISHLIELRGGKEDSIWTEIEKRRRILDFMHKNKIMEFAEVNHIIKAYYKNPVDIFNYIEKFIKK